MESRSYPRTPKNQFTTESQRAQSLKSKSFFSVPSVPSVVNHRLWDSF